MIPLRFDGLNRSRDDRGGGEGKEAEEGADVDEEDTLSVTGVR